METGRRAALTDQFNENVEVMADIEVLKATLQRLANHGVLFGDQVHDQIDSVEEDAAENLTEAEFALGSEFGENVVLKFREVTEQGQQDIITQIKWEREIADEEFARGFDEAHAATEMDF